MLNQSYLITFNDAIKILINPVYSQFSPRNVSIHYDNIRNCPKCNTSGHPSSFSARFYDYFMFEISSKLHPYLKIRSKNVSEKIYVRVRQIDI